MAKRKSSLSLFKRKGKMKEREQALLCIVLATAGGIVTMFLMLLLFAINIIFAFLKKKLAKEAHK